MPSLRRVEIFVYFEEEPGRRSAAKSLQGPPAPLRTRKQRVGLAHEPVSNEADPLLRGIVEVVQG